MAPLEPPRPDSILQTKLYRPQATEKVLFRKRLHEQMHQCLKTPLTLVSAAAGYGKSTLVSQWAESSEVPCAWLSLDAEDSDLTVFCRYAVAAIRKLFHDACPETDAMIVASAKVPVQILCRCLVNELDALETPLVLVLDDYHSIDSGSDVQELLNMMLDHPSPFLRLMIITRSDPPLRIASLRGRGAVTEVRSGDLRFTELEISDYYEELVGSKLSTETLANLVQQTEGWAVGLHLVALCLVHTEEREAFLKDLRAGTPQSKEYLLQQVLSGLSPVMRDWLLKTSILERFCAELCEGVCRTEDPAGSPDIGGRQFIDSLQYENLFTVSLDSEGVWFRYHNLFRELLTSLLLEEQAPERVAALHARASTWLAGQGLIEEAIKHALKSGDVSSAVNLVEQNRYELLNTEQWDRLERWLSQLPDDTVTTNPVLMCTRAYICDYRGKMAEAFANRDQAEALLPALGSESPGRKAVEGEIAALHALQAFSSGDGDRARKASEVALELIPPEARHLHSLSVGFRALALQVSGDLSGSLEVLGKALAEFSAGGTPYQTRVTLFFCPIHMMAGRLDRLGSPALHCIERAKEFNLRTTEGAARYFLGVSHYLRNELHEAERELSKLLDDRFFIRTYYVIHGAAALASLYSATGRAPEAARVLELAAHHMSKRGDFVAKGMVRAFEMDLAIRQGRIDDARRLLQGAEFDPFPPVWFYYVSQLTPARLLLAEKRPEGLKKAGERLGQLEKFLRRTHRVANLIDVLSLQALVLDAQGAEQAALEQLGDALALAKPGGIIRCFLDLGQPMAELLRHAMKQGMHGAQIREILAAFGAEGSRPATDAEGLVEPLTNREEDILELLQDRLRDKEIADKLCISPATVKYHLRHIYQKFGVRNRREAVRKARDMGWLFRR